MGNWLDSTRLRGRGVLDSTLFVIMSMLYNKSSESLSVHFKCNILNVLLIKVRITSTDRFQGLVVTIVDLVFY